MSREMRRRMAWKSRWGTATSAIWKVTYRGGGHDLRADLDELSLEGPQRPKARLGRESDTEQEVPQVVGQREQLEADLVVHEVVAGELRPLDRVLALLDPLLRHATPVVKLHHAVRVPAQVGDDEAHAGKQLAAVPLDLRHHAPGLVPARRPIREALAPDDWAADHVASEANGTLTILHAHRTVCGEAAVAPGERRLIFITAFRAGNSPGASWLFNLLFL